MIVSSLPNRVALRANKDGWYSAPKKKEPQEQTVPEQATAITEPLVEQNNHNTYTEQIPIANTQAQQEQIPRTQVQQEQMPNTQAQQKDPLPAADPADYRYDPSGNAEYLQAMAALQQAQQNVPTYQGTYDQQLLDVYNQIVGRDKFSYNVNEDALYRQYADQYTMQGKLAMMDTMGQAAALTGGYGSSYGQAAGQQAYQGYLQRLNEVVPELYGMALDQYNQEGQDLLNQYSMLGQLRDTEYGRYQDAMDRYWQDVSYQKNMADSAYDRGFNEWYTAQQMAKDADDTAYERGQDAYSKQQDAYDNLVSMMTGMGYSPTAEELAAAGMSQNQAQAFLDYYKAQTTPKYSYVPTAPVPLTGEELEKIQSTATVYAQYGEDSLANYLNYMVNSGGLDANVASGIYDQLFPEKPEKPKKPSGNGGR